MYMNIIRHNFISREREQIDSVYLPNTYERGKGLLLGELTAGPDI